jgi:hypothetical protein
MVAMPHAKVVLAVHQLCLDLTRAPSVVARNLQCDLVREVATQEKCHWSHAGKSFKRAGVGTNGILECGFLSENAHRTNASGVGW